MASENNNCNGEDNAVQEMTDKMSSATFGDAGDQGHASEREEFDQSVDDKLGDSMMDFDNTQELDESECHRANQRAVWDVTEPSEDYLNKLDGWSPKLNSSSRDDSSDMSLDALPISALESWLKENLPDDYREEHILKANEKVGYMEKRKSRVRWADVESRLQTMGIVFHSGYDSAASGSEA